MRKFITVIFILLLLVGLAYAGDIKKEDKKVDDVVKDKNITDATKETSKEIKKDSGIKVKDTASEISKYKYFKDKNKITISKNEAKDKKGKQLSHTKTILTVDEKTAKSIDVDKDGKFGYLRMVDGQVVDSKTVTLAELTTGIDATFSDVIIDGFAGSYTKTGSSQNISTNMSLGQSFNSSKTSAMTVNISTTAYGDPYSEIAALNPVAWYKFDASSGATVSDSSGNGYHGTAYYGMTWVPGKYKNSGKFDGSNDYVGVPISESMNLSGKEFTLNFWIYPTSTSDDVLDLCDASTHGLRFYLASGSFMDLYRNASGAHECWNFAGFTANKWYMISIVQNNTHHSVYANGIFKESVATPPLTFKDETTMRIGSNLGAGQYDGKFDNFVYIAGKSLNSTQISTLYYDGLTQFQAKTNANSTYSGYWNSSSNNPLTLPISSLDGLMSSIQFKVPVNVTQNGVTIYNYNQTVAPFTPIASVLFTNDITEITDSHTATIQTVNISHTSTNTAQSGSLIPYEILDGYDGTATFQTNNPNASISRNETAFVISTGYLPANSTYYYNVQIPNHIEEMLWYDWDPTNETCNAKVQIGNSTPYTTWNITTYNVTDGSLYKLVYAGNGTEAGNATAANGSASIIILGLVDGVYWLTETPVLIGFINVPAVAVVIIGAAGAFVGGSFINKWYRRRRGS
jgi:hypothetical protein